MRVALLISFVLFPFCKIKPKKYIYIVVNNFAENALTLYAHVVAVFVDFDDDVAAAGAAAPLADVAAGGDTAPASLYTTANSDCVPQR